MSVSEEDREGLIRAGESGTSYQSVQSRQKTRQLIRKTLVSLVTILAIAAVCGVLLRDWIERTGGWFIDHFGIGGLFGSVVFVDSSLIPMTNEPLMILALGADLNTWVVFGVVSGGSVLAGSVGYFGGILLDRYSTMQDRFRRWNPDAAEWIEERGAVGVCVAALLPVPFAFATWTAGVMRVPYGGVLLATLLRVPKTGFYLALMLLGYSVGA